MQQRLPKRLKGLGLLGFLSVLWVCGAQPVGADTRTDGVDKGAIQSVLGKKVAPSGKVVAIVKADWCGGCRKTMDSAKTLKDVQVELHDIEKNRTLTSVVPLTALFRDGKLLDTHVGAMTPDQIRHFAAQE